MRTKIKICGLTRLEDALAAIELGADALGFIFVKESPRQVSPEKASAIISQLPPFVLRVGVFKDQDPELIRETAGMCSLHICQLHGDESPDYCRGLGVDYIKAFRIKDESSLAKIPLYKDQKNRRRPFLLDTYVHGMAGGTGRTFDWGLARKASAFGPVILSGGLDPENVSQAVAQIRPFAVDASSGVETSPGKKDTLKLKRFIEQVNQTDCQIYLKH